MRGPTRFFYSETLQDNMKACIILHNTIVKDKRDVNEAVELDYEQIDDNPTIQLSLYNCHESTQMNLWSSLKPINVYETMKFILNSN